VDSDALATMIVYGTLGLVPLLYNYKAVRGARVRKNDEEDRRTYIVVRPRQIDLGELEALLGAGSYTGVDRAEEADA
jgi:hypothetical protein